MLDDSIGRLLHEVDKAVTLRQPQPGLADRVRQRKHHRDLRTRATIAACIASAILVAAFVGMRQISQPSSVATLNAAEVARLRAEVDSLAEQADALERQIGLARHDQSSSELLDESRRRLILRITDETSPSPIDHAAITELCQGDFYWECTRSVELAQTAYEMVLHNFPDSRWAAVARARLEQFQMD
jgi:hypothetical protein